MAEDGSPGLDRGVPLEGGVVVLTGASAGVGRACARAFAARGARLGLLARGRERLEATRDEVERLGGEALVLPTDVSDPRAVEDAAEAVEERLGPVDVWVNNAMVTVFAPVRDMEPEEYRRVTEVNYLGTVYGTLSALRRMLPRDRGRIVQVGSALAYRGIPIQSAYCATKHAIQGFTESLRTELYHEDSGVSIGMVQLPALNTPQFEWQRNKMGWKAQPVPPIFQPEVAAEAIVWSAEHDRPEMYVGGSTVRALAANRVLPRALDHYLGAEGIEGQLTDEPDDPDRPDNLFEPVAGDYAAHGRFDARASERSLQLWATEHRGLTALMAAGLVAAGAAFMWRGGRTTRG